MKNKPGNTKERQSGLPLRAGAAGPRPGSGGGLRGADPRPGRGGRTVRPSDLAHSLGVTHVTVLRALDRLLRDGIITRDPEQGILLSPDGRRMAEASRERHRIVVSFLERLGVPEARSLPWMPKGSSTTSARLVLARMAGLPAGTGARKLGAKCGVPHRFPGGSLALQALGQQLGADEVVQVAVQDLLGLAGLAPVRWSFTIW